MPDPVRTFTGQRFTTIGAIALTCPFWVSGMAKLLDWRGAVAEATHFGLQPAGLIAALVIAVQLSGSAMIVLRVRAWIGAGALSVFTVLATLIAHPFWNVLDPVARFHERNTFLEHVGLVGGLMLAAALHRPLA